MNVSVLRRSAARLECNAALRLTFSLAALLATAAGDALAQATPSQLPPIVVQGDVPKAAPKKRATPAQTAAQPKAPPTGEKARQDVPSQVPEAVSTATKTELDTFGQVNTGDVLRAMSGTYTRESPNNSGIAVNIRGLEGSGRVNMMIDGVRQNFRFTTHEAQGLLYVDPALLAGIDISRGSLSTTGGAGALAGSANFRTLGIDDMILPGHKSGVISTLSWGSNGQGFTEMLGAATRVDGVAIGGAISHREPGDYKNGDGITVPYSRQDITSGLVKAELGRSANNRLTLGGVFYNNDFYAQAVNQTIDSRVLTAKYRYTSADNPLVDFRLNLSSSDVEMVYGDAITSSSSAGRFYNDKGRGGDISNVSRFSFGALNVKTEYGAEYFHDTVSGGNSRNASAGAGVNGAGESSIGGVFSKTTWSHGIFDLITAARYDRYTIDGTFTATTGNALGLPVGTYNLSRDEGRVNPRVTLAAQVTPWLQPFATYNEAFRPPTVQETMLGGSHPGGSTQFSPNPFLRPEVLRGWELGANVKRDGLLVRNDSFRAKINYFNNNIDDYITGVFGSTGKAYFDNIAGTSNLQGVELQGSYDMGLMFSSMSYTYTHSELPSQINGLGAQSYLPRNILVLTAGLRFLEQRLTVGGRANFTSDGYIGSVNVTTPGVTATPGYSVWDLFTSYKINDNVTIGANVNNVFDKSYTPALSSPPTVTCPAPALTCNTGIGRTVLFTLKSQF
ncbi:MAG: TonB-dependent receptor [Hyphomicrobiaceae bacterium]|nr:TonB-dependent receptor [Hyphomicrobiaceae bacterium]